MPAPCACVSHGVLRMPMTSYITKEFVNNNTNRATRREWSAQRIWHGDGTSILLILLGQLPTIFGCNLLFSRGRAYTPYFLSSFRRQRAMTPNSDAVRKLLKHFHTCSAGKKVLIFYSVVGRQRSGASPSPISSSFRCHTDAT